MKSNDTPIDTIPMLIGFEEEPAALSEAWQQFFIACWDAYELIQQRRAARQRVPEEVPIAETANCP